MAARKFPTGVWEFDTVQEAVEFERLLSARIDTSDESEPGDEFEEDEFDDADVDSKRETEKSPLDKRGSQWAEPVKVRAERLLLVMNQLGPQHAADLARHISTPRRKWSSENVRYALKAVKHYRLGALFAAGRLSKLWTDADEEMFGSPQASDADAETAPASALEASHRGRADDYTNEATDPIGKRRSPICETPKARAERILLVLNQLGPISMAEVAQHIRIKDFATRYAALKTAVVSLGGQYGAQRVSALWNAEDEAMFGPPKLCPDGTAWGHEALVSEREGELSARDRKREARAASVVIGLGELSQRLEGALEAACPT